MRGSSPRMTIVDKRPPALLRHLTKRFSDRQHRMPDQSRILDACLTVLHRFPIDGITDHLGERSNAWIFGDEAMIPALLLGPDQHQFKFPLPNDPAAQPFKHRAPGALRPSGYAACCRSRTRLSMCMGPGRSLA